MSDPDRIARHAFYPFIRYIAESHKITKVPGTGTILKKPVKKRQISFAAHADAHIYSYYGHMLAQLYESQLKASGIDQSVLAFRSLGKSNVHFAHEAFVEIEKMGDCVAFATDITGFFDNLDHGHLKSSWASILGGGPLPPDHFAVFKSLTRYAYVMKNELFSILGFSENNPPKAPSRLCSGTQFRDLVRKSGLILRHTCSKGIPQGSPISALLSNIYLLEFDSLLNAEIVKRNGVYMRYCDDILCIVPLGRDSGLREDVEKLIGKYHLELNDGKTETITFSACGGRLVADKPLQYLGFTFDGTRKLIRSAAFAKFSEKMRRGVNLAKQTARKHNYQRPLPQEIWRFKLYERYSHLGRRNFVTYGLRAAKVMGSPAMKKQLKPLWSRLSQRIESANAELLLSLI